MQFRVFAVRTAAVLIPTLTLGQSIDFGDPEAVARAAVERHPAVARFEAEARAAHERVRIAGAYPNPMLMGGVQDQQIDLSTDEMMTMYMAGASQSIPRRSRREALRASAVLVASRIELEALSVREEIRRDALFAWYDLAAADSQIIATEQVAVAVDALVAAARFRYEVGSSIQADVIRAQLQRSEIDHQLITLNGTRSAAAGRLLAWLGLPLATRIPRVTLAHGTAALGVEHEDPVLDTHPALRAAQASVEGREQDLRLANLLGRPDWSLEASYGMRPEQIDMFSVVARVELPVRKKSIIEPQVRAAAAERDSARQRVEEVRREIREALAVAAAAHEEASRQLEFHEQVLVPQSRLAFESTLAAYQAGKDNFESVLASEAAYLRLQTDYYEFLARHIKAIIDSEALQRGARFGALAGGQSAIGSSESRSPATPMRGGMR